jgi:hypothetical protein
MNTPHVPALFHTEAHGFEALCASGFAGAGSGLVSFLGGLALAL